MNQTELNDRRPAPHGGVSLPVQLPPGATHLSRLQRAPWFV